MRGPEEARSHDFTYSRAYIRDTREATRAMIHGAFVSGEASLYERPQVY